MFQVFEILTKIGVITYIEFYLYVYDINISIVSMIIKVQCQVFKLLQLFFFFKSFLRISNIFLGNIVYYIYINFTISKSYDTRSFLFH